MPAEDHQLQISPLSSQCSTLDISCDWEELRCIYHFRNRSIKELSELMDAGFWQKYVFELALSAPAIKYAMVALGAMHENYLSQQTSLLQGNALQTKTPLSTYSLGKYGEAIQSLNSRIDHANKHNDVVGETLVAALLFAFFEVIQGSDLAALKHLEGGLFLLNQLRMERSEPSKLFVDREDLFSSSLVKAFERLDLQASAFIGSRQIPDVEKFVKPNYLPPVALPIYFSTLSEARNHLNGTLKNAYQFLRSTSEVHKYVPSHKPVIGNYNIVPALPTFGPIPPSTFQDRDTHIKALKRWSVVFQDLLCRASRSSAIKKTKIDEAESKEYATTWMSYLVTLIKVSTSLDANETVYDSHLSHFEAILEQADAVLCPRPNINSPLKTNREKQGFTIEMNFIHPLYFTALKCRSPTLRRKAVSLLRLSAKEGVWDGHIMARIAEHAISVEEAGTYDGEESGAAPLPECKRIHGVAFNFDRPSRKVWIQCSRRIPSSELMDDGKGEWDSGRDGKVLWNMHEEIVSW